MEIYYICCLFVFGTIFGSFYNVVGSRLAKGESIVFPGSHCTYCNHKLGVFELIPVFSYIFQKGRCKKCKKKLSIYYPMSECLTGLLFALCYIVFGFSLHFVIGIIFVSILMMIIASDIENMIIPDELLVIGSILIFIILIFEVGMKGAFLQLLQGVCSFFFMWGLKLFGDFLFKKESMGGGDIKLLFLFGLVLGFPLSIVSIFLGSMIGLPISIFFMSKKRSDIIPFGPYLCFGAITLFLLNIPFADMLKALTFYS